MSYLVDTNIISEVRKGDRCDANVAAWFEDVEDADLYLSVLMLGEIRRGIELARARDATKADALEAWISAVTVAFQERILPIDRAVAEAWGTMGATRPIPTVDGLLAATAKVHGMTLVTRNEAHVVGLGAKVLNPFR